MFPSPPPPNNPISTPDLSLLPSSKLDIAAIKHLHTLSPSVWTPLIDLPHPFSPSQPPIWTSYSLIDWTADINWPITRPICHLLLTLVNDPKTRGTYGDVYAHTVKRVLRDVTEWDWVYVVLVFLVDGIEDREWMRSMFGETLRGMKGWVPGEEWEGDEGWELGECVGKCLDGGRDGERIAGFDWTD